MEIKFKQGSNIYHGKVVTIEKDKEFQYFIDLGRELKFTIRLSDEGNWVSDNPSIDPLLVLHAGETTYLNPLSPERHDPLIPF